MKKFLFFIATLATGFAFGQITLEHSFSSKELVYAYSTGTDLIYVSEAQDNKLKIYNPDFTLYKTVNVLLPAGYELLLDVETYNGPLFAISKHIFNTDDKYEFMVEADYYDSTTQNYYTKLLLINEDGQLIKDFHPNPSSKKYRWYYVFHDSVTNVNKLIVNNQLNGSDDQADVYSLPTSSLTTKEIQTKNKLSAFPIPTNKILNIYNPKNNANKVEVFDTTGKLIISKSFNINEDKISVNVENLMKGSYIYKVGDLTSKFIKE